MEVKLQIIIAVFTSVMASSGFWAYLNAVRDRKHRKKEKEEAKNSIENKMLLGLGHDRIIWLCMKYIDRGWITKDEFEDLNNYLYSPYKDMGGNGTAERLMNEVKKLPVKNMTYLQQARSKSQ